MNDQTTLYNYRIVASPIGELLLVSSCVGIVQVAFEVEDFDAILASFHLSPTAVNLGGTNAAGAHLELAAGQLAEFFSGSRQLFSTPLDHVSAGAFASRVQQYLASIPYGQMRSYQQIATSLESPRAVRAVGSACAKNPLPLFLPCHRVLRSDGSLGGFRGGLAAKVFLLDLEKSNLAI